MAFSILDGFELRTSEYLTEAGGPVQVPRSWKERLMPVVISAFPRLLVDWRPWEASKTVIPQVPMKGAMRVGNIMYVHPAALQTLRQVVDSRWNTP